MNQVSKKNLPNFWKTVRANINQKHIAPPIKQFPRSGNIPLSFAQERLWLIEQLQPESSVHNTVCYLPFNGAIAVPALEKSLREIIHRHEILRTAFLPVDGKPVQVITPQIEFNLNVIDLRELPENQRQKELKRTLIESMQKPFDLTQAPLWRFQLITLTESQHGLVGFIHHIIFDAWSGSLFKRELSQLYEAFSTGNPSPLPPLAIQYADFAFAQREWLQGEVLEHQLNYWKQKLSGPITPLQLPSDRPRPNTPSHKGTKQSLTLSAELTKALKVLSRQENVSLFVTLLTTFKVLLYRYTGQTDLILSSPIANRNRVETKKLIGYFNNILALRTDVSGNPTFRELLYRVSQVVLGANEHQDVPLHFLSEFPNVASIPLWRGMFALQNLPSQPNPNNINIFDRSLEQTEKNLSSLHELQSMTANFDLYLSIKEGRGQLKGVLEYKIDLFEAATITQILENFQLLLETFVATPDLHIGELPSLKKNISLDTKQIETVLTQHPYIKETIVLVEEDVFKDPRLVAYVVPNQEQVPSLEELRNFLQKKLPNYMIPSALVPIEAMPFNSSGEIDTSALSSSYQLRQQLEISYEAPRNPTETKLAAIWKKVLWLDREIGIHDNFFDLGGHSLLSARLISEIEGEFNTIVPLKALSNLSTIAELGKILDEETETNQALPESHLDSETYHRLLAYTAGWQGERVKQNSLIVGMNTKGTKQPLFFCFNQFIDFAKLSQYMGLEQPIYGMRSYTGIFQPKEYTENNIKALASQYVSEILSIESQGPYLLGGSCQAAWIIEEVAHQLITQGKTITLLCLIQQVTVQPYPGRVTFLFRRDSNLHFNPYKNFHYPELGWCKLYPQGFSVDMLPGDHDDGRTFMEPLIQMMAEKLRIRIEEAQSVAFSPQVNPEKYQLLSLEAYQAQLIAQPSLKATTEEKIVIPVIVKNISSVTWQSTNYSGIVLANHWLDENEKVIQWLDGSISLPHDLQSGEQIELGLSVTLPIQAGRYFLELDLVEEGVTWFQYKNSVTTKIEVEVVDSHSTLVDINSGDYRLQGNYYYDKGSADYALINYEKAIKLNSIQFAEVYQNLGKIYYTKGNISEAINAYRKSLELKFDNAQVYFMLGEIYLQEGKLSEAAEAYQKTIELDPKYIISYEKLGQVLNDLNQNDRAIEVLEAAIKLDQNNPYTHSLLANNYIKSQNVEAAISLYHRAIELNPDDLNIYCQLGQAYCDLGDIETAINCYKKVIELNPQFSWAYVSWGNILNKQGSVKEAISLYQKAIELEPDHPTGYNALGNIQRQQKDFESAILSYRRSLELNPQQFNTYTALGNTSFQLGKTEEAITAYTEAIKLDPNCSSVYGALGNAQLKCENIREAIASYQKAVELNPKQPFIVYKNLGDALSKKGEIEGAISAYNQALKLQPHNQSVRQSLATIKQGVICVLGMHRSGTSCLAGSLQAAGLFSGEVEDWNVDNLKGNRENTEIMSLNDAVLAETNGSWDNPPVETKWSQKHQEKRDAIATRFYSHAPVWMFKDPRTLLTLSFWQEGITNLQFIGTFRHPLKVAMSLYQRNEMPLREGINLWLHYNHLLLKEWKKSHFPLLCFDVPPSEYLEQLEQVIANFSHLNLSLKEARKFYETTLVHQKNLIAIPENSQDSNENNDTNLLATASKLYQDLKEAAGVKIDETSLAKSSYLIPLAQTIPAYEEAIELQPDNPHLCFMLGNTQYKEEDFSSAISSYQKAIKLEPEYFWVYQNLASTFTKLEQLDAAINTYKEALKLQPNNPHIYCLLGNTHLKQGEIEAAINYYKKALVASPQFIFAHVCWGKTLQKQGNTTEAIAVYKKAIELNSENTPAYLYKILGHAQRQEQDYDSAILSYRRSLALDPEEVHTYTVLGNTLNILKKTEEAIAVFARALELDPNHIQAYNGLAKAQQEQQDFAGAILSYRRSVELDSNQFNIYNALGWCLSITGNLTEAIDAYENAIKLEPNQDRVYGLLGNVYFDSEKLDKAIASYQKAIELNPKQSFKVYKNFGDALNQQGNTEKAIAAYQEALKLKPNNQALARRVDNLQ